MYDHRIQLLDSGNKSKRKSVSWYLVKNECNDGLTVLGEVHDFYGELRLSKL